MHRFVLTAIATTAVLGLEVASAGTASEFPIVVQANDHYVLRDLASGKTIGDTAFEDISPFSGGLAAVRLGSVWGYIDRSGTFVIRPQFIAADNFSEGRAVVKTGDGYSYIDQSGAIALNGTFDRAKAFGGGFAPVLINGTWTYINGSGKVVTNAQYEIADAFSDGLAAVRVSGRWGFINDHFQLVIAPRFAAAGEFSQGLAPVEVGSAGSGAYGYIDPTGKFRIPATFKAALSFSGGLAAVEIGSRWGYINADGSTRIAPQFIRAYRFTDGLGRVVDGVFGRSLYIDSSNKTIAIRSAQPESAIGGYRLVQLFIDSTPSHVPVYLVPQVVAETDPSLLTNKTRLDASLYRPFEGDTTPLQTSVYEQVYLLVYVWNGHWGFKKLNVVGPDARHASFSVSQ